MAVSSGHWLVLRGMLPSDSVTHMESSSVTSFVTYLTGTFPFPEKGISRVVQSPQRQNSLRLWKAQEVQTGAFLHVFVSPM